MNVSESINALNQISADFGKIPGRINQVFADTLGQVEPKEGLEQVMTDILVQENAFTANAKALHTMNTVEDILLEDLRKQG